MPVTARLSRKFSETFGDDIANELVDWFNQVDATYRSELRELNDLNFARFEAKLDQRVGDLRAALGTTEERVARLLAEQRSDMMKWMFIFWAGAVLVIVGSMTVLFKLFA